MDRWTGNERDREIDKEESRYTDRYIHADI
jgi:hypothetical protein